MASVGPPSSSSDWTPSSASAASSSASGPVRSSSSEPVGQRAAAEGEAARLARCLHVARVEPRIVGADGAHPDGDGVRGRP